MKSFLMYKTILVPDPCFKFITFVYIMTVFACTTAKLVFARKNLPSAISEKIIMLVYKAEHAEQRGTKLLPDIRKSAAARATRRMDAFPEYAEQVIRETYNCLCCTRHQHSKATFDVTTGHPTVAHNPALFILPLNGYHFHREHPFPYHGVACECACRHIGRHALRMYLENNEEYDYMPMRDRRLGLYDAPDDYGHQLEYEAWAAEQQDDAFEELAAAEEQQEQEAIMVEQAEPEIYDLYNDAELAYWGEERP